MNAYDGYKLFLALKQHFQSLKYDYFKYNGHVTASKEKFLMRKDRYSFHKLTRKYTDLEGFYVANFVYSDPQWSGDLMTDQADANYKRWLKIQNALTKVFKDDLDTIKGMGDDILTVKNGQNPKLLVAAYQMTITIETLLILDQMFSFIDKWNEQIKDTIIWPKYYLKLVKYRPWIQKLNITKFKELMK